jgi:catechol 2,3-dioxygenase-like lactoylglutathione lyase family enzyme
MRTTTTLIALTASLLIAPTAVMAQLITTGPVVNGHHHLNVTDVDEHLRFWVDTLGGKPGTFGSGTRIVLFPDALVFLRDQDPSGPSIGSTVNHVGFSVQDLRETVDRLVEAGYEMVTSTQAPPGVRVVDDIGILGGDGPVSGIAYVVGPDGIKVEVLEMREQDAPIVSHHIHFFGENSAAMRDWYMDVFGATARSVQTAGIIGADLPGLGLNFTATSEPMAGTAGRVIDHIGFEVEDLRAFIARLEAKGITLDRPYREIPAAGVAIAFFTDPWGTYIELTEGLDGVR